MNYRKNKIERLSRVAHMYYEEDRTQGEIADLLHVSRPLVSRMLREARDLGIVEIRVHQPVCDVDALLGRLCQRYGLQGGVLIPEAENNSMSDFNLAQKLLEYIEAEQPKALGIGWGTIIGALTSLLERVPPRQSSVQTVCPLVGNSSVSSRRFHTDENVRIIAEGLCAQPKFLYTPAFPADMNERNLLSETSHYRAISEQCDDLVMAVVGIHETTAAVDVDCPLVQDNRTVGHMVAYSYDINGRFIRPESDYLVHIPLEKLAKCRQVIGLCAADVSPRALAGALRTGLLTHVFARETLVDAVMTDKWNYA